MESKKKTSTPRYTDVVFDHFPLATALFDTQDLRLLTANPRFHDLLDPTWRDGRAFGHTLSALIPGWFPQIKVLALLAVFHRTAQTGIPSRREEQALVVSGGETTYWTWTLDPVRDREGHITQLLLTASEVTAHVLARQDAQEVHTSPSQEQRKVEAELRGLKVIESVGRSLRETLDMKKVSIDAINAIRSHFDPLYVYTHIADPSHTILRLLHIRPVPEKPVLRAVQRIPYDGPYPVAEAYRQREPIIIDDLQTAVPQDLRERLYQLVTDEGHGYICVPLWFGDQFEGTLSAIFKEIISPDGSEVLALVGSGTHLAAALAHARLHSTIENERARLRTVLDQLPEGVVIAEATNGHVSYTNAAASSILGLPIAQLVDAPLNRYPLTHLVTTRDGQPVLPWNFAIIHALSGETISSQETMVIRPDGSHVVTLSSAAPLRLENGLVTGAAIVFQDITARKSLEEHKNEFLSIASHELRTPVTAIMGYAELLQQQAAQGQSLSPADLRAIAGMSEQSQFLNQLIEELLDMSQLDYAHFSLHSAPHDLLKTLLAVIEGASATTRNHQLRLVLEGLQPTDALPGSFDERRIRQVLYNLIGNAIKYSPAGGEIEVGLRQAQEQPDEVLIWVKDTGIGIAADELPHIFERFHRASNLNRSISGLGIGLYLAKEVVTRHRGHIWVESIEGSGSTFSMRLPLKQRPFSINGDTN